jgi:hypothetical protein
VTTTYDATGLRRKRQDTSGTTDFVWDLDCAAWRDLSLHHYPKAWKTFRAEVEVRSYASETQEAVVRLNLPDEWTCLPLMQTLDVPPGEAARTFFRVTPPEVIKPVRRRIITADVTLGDVPLGQAAEAVVEFDGPRLMLR